MLDRNPLHLLRVLLLLLLSLASLSASAALERIRGTHTETRHGVATTVSWFKDWSVLSS